MRVTAGKSVTITLKAYEPPPPLCAQFKEGQIINLGWSKRIKGLVKNIDSFENGVTLTLKNGYMAAPKSQLRHKTIFSKINSPILNPLKEGYY